MAPRIPPGFAEAAARRAAELAAQTRPLSHASDLANVLPDTQVMMDNALESGAMLGENIPAPSPESRNTVIRPGLLPTATALDPALRFMRDPNVGQGVKVRFSNEEAGLTRGRDVSAETDLGGDRWLAYGVENIPAVAATVAGAGALLAGKEAMASEDPRAARFKAFAALPREQQREKLKLLKPEQLNAFVEAFNEWKQSSVAVPPPVEQGPLAPLQPSSEAPATVAPPAVPPPIAAPRPGAIPSFEGQAIDWAKKNVVDPVLETAQKYVTRPAFEYAVENPKTAAVASALRVPFVIPIMGALTKGPIEKTTSPSAKGMGAGEILLRQAAKPFVGAGAVPGGVNFSKEVDADKPEALEMVNTLEGVPVLGKHVPAMLSVADQAGQLPFWVLGNGTAQAIEAAVVAGGGVLASAKLLPTVVRSALGAAAEGAIGGGAQETLTVGGDPLKGASYGAAFGGVVGGVATPIVRGIQALKTKVVSMWGGESRQAMDGAISAFVNEPDAPVVPPEAAPLLENAPIPVKQEAVSVASPAPAPLPRKTEPLHIKVESVLDPARREKPMRVTVTEVHVSNGELKKVQYAQDMSWLESQKFVEKHGSAVVDMDPVASALGAQFERVPKEQVDLPAEVPEALVVKTGEDGVEKLVKQPMEAVDIRAPNERRAGDVVRMGDVVGILEGPTLKHEKIRVRVNGKIELWPPSEVKWVQDTSEMAQQELAKTVPTPEAAPPPTDKTPIVARANVPVDRTTPGRRKPTGPAPIELLPSSAPEMMTKTAKGQRFGPVVGGERKLELKHVIDAVKVWQVVTPKRLISSRIAQDMPEALSLINLLESTGVVYRGKPGRGATYLYNENHPRRLYETAEEFFGGDTLIKSRIDDIKSMIERKTPADALPTYIETPATPTEKAAAVEEMLKPDNAGYLVTYRTDEMRAAGAAPRNGVIKGVDVNGNLVVVDARPSVHVERDTSGKVVKRTRLNAEVRVKLGKEANMLLPATLPKATLRDVLKTNIPGVTTPVDIQAFLQNPPDLGKIRQNVQEIMRREASLRNTVVPPALRNIWRRTFGGGHDYVPAALRPVAQRLAGMDTGRDMATRTYRSITGEGLRPFSDASNELRPVLEGTLRKMPANMQAWAKAHPEVAASTVAQVQTTIDYIQDLQGRLAEAGVTAVQIKNLAPDELATMYLKAAYETFVLGPEKRLATIERQLDRGGSPALDAAVAFFTRKGKTAAEVRADIAAVLREPDVGLALEKRGYVAKGVGASLAERTVWDTPELKAVKDLLGPIEDPVMRLTMSLQAAEAAYATAKAGDLLVNTPYFSRVAREDLTYRVPDDARYGRAAGGYTTPELAPFLDPSLMVQQAQDHAKMLIKAIRVWKMTNTALGSSTVFLNNVMQNIPSLYASGGMAGFIDGSVADVLSGMYHYSKSPTGIGPQNIIREAQQLGVLGSTMSHMETSFQTRSMQRELWADILKNTGGQGSYAKMVSAGLSFLEKKGVRSAEAVLALYDSIDQIAKATTYVTVKKGLLKKGLSNDEAATQAAARVLRYFPDWHFVPPWVAKTRHLQGIVLAPFLSSITNGMRITANIASDTAKAAVGQLPDNPYIALRMAAGVGVGAVLYKGVEGIARARGMTEAKEIEYEQMMSLKQKSRHPVRIWIGETTNAKGEKGGEYIDITSWNDLTRPLRGVMQGDPFSEQLKQYAFQVGIDLLAPQAQLAAQSAMAMSDLPGRNTVQRMPTTENTVTGVGRAAWETFKPGLIRQQQRIWSELQDQQALTRSQVPWTTALLEELGLGAGFVTPTTALDKIQEYTAPAKNLSSDAFQISGGFNQDWAQKTDAEREAAMDESVKVMENEYNQNEVRRGAQ